MECSSCFKTSSIAVASPCAKSIASLVSSPSTSQSASSAAGNAHGASTIIRLQIRSRATLQVTHSFALPSSTSNGHTALDVKSAAIAWAPATHPLQLRAHDRTRPSRRQAKSSTRILVHDAHTVRAFDLHDRKWSAVISNGSGGMGRIAHASFGDTGEEVLVWGEFGSRVGIWDLRSGRRVDVADPKVLGTVRNGWGYRPVDERLDGEEGERQRRKTRVLALLCRTAGRDYLLLLRSSDGYKPLKKVELQTVDAQGIRWSRDGRWIAVWEGASHGHKLLIYTADGHLYRSVSREPSDDLEDRGIEGLGIKSVEWVPGGEFLAVGGWDRRVRILSTRTFAPAVFLDHTPQISVPGAAVYAETVDAGGTRSYVEVSQPATPPTAVLEKGDTAGLMRTGIGILAFNGDGSLCATRDDAAGSTVWIWDLRSLRPRTILFQHAPVRGLQWHPSDPSRLAIYTAAETPVVYIYAAEGASSTGSAGSSMTARSHSQPKDAPPMIVDLAPRIAGLAPARPPASSTAPPAPKWACTWLAAASSSNTSSLLMAHQKAYALVFPDGRGINEDEGLRDEDEAEAEARANDSDDSLYDILTGRTPVPPPGRGVVQRQRRSPGGSVGSGSESEGMEMQMQMDGGYEETTVGLEDTFGGRRMAQMERDGGLAKARGRSVFEESGMDEMF